jgi:Tol biopolymer transport system component
MLPPTAPRPVLRATIVDPDRPVLPNPLGFAIALSPDGTRAVYRTQTSSGLALAVRSLDSLETRLLFESPNGASSPVFSPDGAWVAFTENRSIKRVALAGGPALSICQVADRVDGMTWTDDGFLIFGAADTAAVNTGLMRVPVEGGTPEPLTTVNAAGGELTHAWPSMLPGGKAVLFTIRQKSVSTAATDSIAVLDLESRSYRTVIAAGHGAARYIPTGHLVYEQQGQLFAVRFDRLRLAVTGSPVAVLTGLATRANGALDTSISDTGTLVYLTDSDDLQTYVPVWVDRRGVAQAIEGIEADRYLSPRLSPDGRRFITVSNGDAWIIETGNGRRRRVTTDGRTGPFAAWSPDGSKVAYASGRSGSTEIWVQSADGIGEPERVTVAKGAEAWHPNSWSPDGRLLAGYRLAGGAVPFVLPLSGADRQPRFLPLARRAAYDAEVQFSPDGRYVAFISGINRQWDVELHPVEGAGRAFPCPSTAAWNRSGRRTASCSTAIRSLT